MFQTKVTFHEGQTPEQRKWHAAYWRRTDEQQHRLNNMLGFWRVCGKPRCRRSRACSHDMHACFARIWPLVPEDQKEWIRGAILAAQGGASADERARAADARRDAYLKNMEQRSPGVRSDADARIRRL